LFEFDIDIDMSLQLCLNLRVKTFVLRINTKAAGEAIGIITFAIKLSLFASLIAKKFAKKPKTLTPIFFFL
jgi:hypothetical protein